MCRPGFLRENCFRRSLASLIFQRKEPAAKLAIAANEADFDQDMNPPRLTPTPAASAPVTSFGMIST